MIFCISCQVNLTGSGFLNRTGDEKWAISFVKKAKKSFFILLKKFKKIPQVPSSAWDRRACVNRGGQPREKDKITRSKSHMIKRSQDQKITRSKGHKIKRSQDQKVTRSNGHKIKWSQDQKVTRSSGHKIKRSQGHKITMSQDCLITRSQGNKITRLQGHNFTRPLENKIA